MPSRMYAQPSRARRLLSSTSARSALAATSTTVAGPFRPATPACCPFANAGLASNHPLRLVRRHPPPTGWRAVGPGPQEALPTAPGQRGSASRLDQRASFLHDLRARLSQLKLSGPSGARCVRPRTITIRQGPRPPSPPEPVTPSAAPTGDGPSACGLLPPVGRRSVSLCAAGGAGLTCISAPPSCACHWAVHQAGEKCSRCRNTGVSPPKPRAGSLGVTS